MRIPSSVFGTRRLLLGLALAVGSVALVSAPKSPFTVHDKAYYLNEAVVSFVRPGLIFTIKSVKIASDGTVTADFIMTDGKNGPLDRDGILSPGAVSTSFLIASIPKGQTQYVSYVTRTENDPNPVVPNAVQATSDSGGAYTPVGSGEYIYTFGTKLPAGFDQTATHSVGIYGSRALTDFGLSTYYASNVFTFMPDGSKVVVTRDVIRTQSCNKCHDQLNFHGGSRRGVELCIMCHTPQTTDSGTGRTVDFKVLIHKIHDGSSLPSVQAGGKYNIIGFGNSSSDWSTVEFPANGGGSSFPGAIKCQACHESTTGAAQANAWATNPNRAACGSCHDNVNFATGENHVNLPQADDKLCSTCHIPKTGQEFDASIMGAHTPPTESATLPGVVVNILKVDNGTAGNTPTVTFTLKDNAGNGIPLDEMKTSPGHLALVMAGPTTDYGYTSFGSDVTTQGYVSEDPTTTGKCSNDGTCTYTFAHAVPSDATGTYSIGIEARRGGILQPGTVIQQSTEYGAINKVVNFSVDGSPVKPRRTVVAIEKCNACHSVLSLHGENRNQIQMCVLCHNPSMDDSPTRPLTKDPVQKALPNQGINFALLIHNIHTGENMKAQGRDYTVVGFGGSVNDFSDIRYPVMSETGSYVIGDRRNCSMCHVNGSEQLPLQDGLNQVSQPQGPLTTMGPATAACTACHGEQSVYAHVSTNTSPQFGEACAACHGSDAEFSVNKVHAQ